MKSTIPIAKRIVLIGGGHAHVTVLRAFGMTPEPGVAITLIAKELDAPYSGMLPGFVAGHYTLDDCHIDLVRLAHSCDARLIHGEAVGVDRRQRRVMIQGRPALGYDVLSIDTGITPQFGDIDGASEHAIAVKPVSTFAPRWEALYARAMRPDGPRRIVVVGTGAAGFELVLAIRHRLRADAARHGIDAASFHFALIGSGGVLPTHNARARSLGLAALRDRSVEVIERDAAVHIAPREITLSSGRRIAADAVLVTTKAAPPVWFADTDLPRNAQGFLAVRPSLQLLDDEDVFAVGDCAAVVEYPREKAGVFAVRQGPPLAENLRRRARDAAAKPFHPQRQFLTLLSLGDRSAIAARGTFAAAGQWAWIWKDRIDRTFMDRFNVMPTMAISEADADASDAMRCGGCAAKIGPLTLARALDRLGSPLVPLAVKDQSPGDDAAVLDLGAASGELRLETVDFFRAIWPEPYVMGEIAAAHALSDVFAKGGVPDHVLAVAVLPYAAPRQSEDDLYQLMAGARAVFDAEGVALVGGHSGEGQEMSIGFFVSGRVARDDLVPKRGLRAGDVLIVTKPLGTGIVFAAWMRGKARAREIAAALGSMRRTNAAAASILRAHGVSAATDVTGFGLAGHLIEMLEASGVGARIDWARCPLLPGVAALAEAGIGSTLLPENLALAAKVAGVGRSDPRLAILFDPQTSGGLIAGIPAAQAEACLAALAACGLTAAAIGDVVALEAAEGASVVVV